MAARGAGAAVRSCLADRLAFARLRSRCFDPGISPQYARSRLCGRPKSSIEYRWAANSDEQMALAVDLVRKGVDLIVTAGTPATVAAKQATTTIPIVFAVAGAPLEKGLVDSLAHPGGNVTGLALIMDVVKALEILKEAAPRVSRVAFIYDPSTVPGRFEEGLAESSSGQVTHTASGRPSSCKNRMRLIGVCSLPGRRQCPSHR